MTDLDLSEWIELCLHKNYTGPHAEEIIDGVREYEERIKKLEDELHTMKTAGIIEVAIRNPDVSEYMAHWEWRAESAESKLAKAVAIAKDAIETMEEGPFFPEREGQRLLAALAELKGQDNGY